MQPTFFLLLMLALSQVQAAEAPAMSVQITPELSTRIRLEPVEVSSFSDAIRLPGRVAQGRSTQPAAFVGALLRDSRRVRAALALPMTTEGHRGLRGGVRGGGPVTDGAVTLCGSEQSGAVIGRQRLDVAGHGIGQG